MKFFRFFSGPLRQTLSGMMFFIFAWFLYRLIHNRSMRIRFMASLGIAGIIYAFGVKTRSKIRKNISLIRPDLDERAVAKGSWHVVKTIARSWAAILGDGRRDFEDFKHKLEVKGIEPLLKAHKKKEKVIIAVGHVGPVDEMFGIIPLYGLQVYIPAEDIRPRWLFKLMAKYREGFGDTLIEPVKKGETLKLARKHLVEGRIVVFAIDVTRNDDKGVLCRIGNGEARFPIGAIKLALEEKAKIFPVFPSQSKDGMIRVVVGAPFRLKRTGNLNQDIELNTRRLIEDVYAPHIQKHWDSWLRLLWSNLRPVKE